MTLNDLYKDIIAENEQIECKARLDGTNILGWLKTVDGFANAKGGLLFLGVEDKIGELLGFELKDVDGEKLYFYHALREHFDVLPEVAIDVVPYGENEKRRYLLKIHVMESSAKPLILSWQGMPCVFKRRDGYTSAATAEELIQMSTQNTVIQFDQGLTDVIFKMEDFKTLSHFYEERLGTPLTEKKLASIGFFDESRRLHNGALLFKDDYDGKASSVVCSIYEGLTRGDDKVLASNKFQGNLIDCFNYMFNFVLLQMNKGFIKKDTYRVDFDAFPRRSVFESLINALAHRDYFIHGSDIFVDLFKNRLVISSPGSIFKDGSNKTTYQLDKLLSCRRNTLISNVFVLCNAMEAKGTGFEKILEDYKNGDDRHKPFIRSNATQFSITLPDLTYEGGVAVEEEALTFREHILNESRHDLKISVYCYSSYRSVKQIAENLGVSNSSFLRKNVIDNLVKQNFLLVKESGNEKLFLTNHDVVSMS